MQGDSCRPCIKALQLAIGLEKNPKHCQSSSYTENTNYFVSNGNQLIFSWFYWPSNLKFKPTSLCYVLSDSF